MSKERFERAAHTSATWQREGKPDPAKVAAKGIKTRESLEWMEAQAPDKPQLTHEIDNDDLRHESKEAARETQREAVRRLRELFGQKSRKARADFRTANEYRQRDRER